MEAKRPNEEPSSAPSGELTRLAERLGSSLRAAGEAVVSRRGMALTLVGALVVAGAWLGERDSAWGFPMLIAGALMIGLGLLGPRLSGSLALRWGEDGAFFQLTSTIAPPGKRHSAPTLTERPEQAELPEKLVPPTEIESTAETVEFKVEANGS